jgi:hypothetical protein
LVDEFIDDDWIITQQNGSHVDYENLNKDSITTKLKSAYYKDWIYLDNKRKTLNKVESPIPRNKKICINNIEYNSIAEATIKTGISRENIKYRLKAVNYKEYFYI